MQKRQKTAERACAENEGQDKAYQQSFVRTAAELGAPRGLGAHTPKQGKVLSGAEIVVACLEAEGVSHVFGYPGGQAIKIFDALYASDQIQHILARHEQGAVHEADGYARSSGDIGVVCVTSGPGATNTVTGIATAYMDSIPLVVITGQVPRRFIGTDAFQESDIVGITMPVVKHSYLLKSIEEIESSFREAFHIARTGRPGPVLIDIPSDIAAETKVFRYPETVSLPSYKPTYKGNVKQIKAAVALLEEAKRPIICAGGGIISSEASEELSALAHRMQIPVVCTLMGKGALPATESLNLGAVGMHGSRFANLALNESDLIIACGTRFSDRVTGRIDRFAPYAKLIHIDIDPAEIGKVREAQVPIVGDLKGVLTLLFKQVEERNSRPQTSDWLAQIKEWKTCYPLYEPAENACDKEILPEYVMRVLSDALDPLNSIVVTEVGQHQMWAAQHIQRELPRTFLSSGGLGTMGFGFPAAIGAAIAQPDKAVVCIAGDGSFQMNMQEMATAAIHKAAVKVLIMDNRCLGMVHQWQRLFCDGRYSATLLDALPDFVLLAQAFGWQARRVEQAKELKAAIEEMLGSEGPYLLDLAISRDQDVYPMVAPDAGLEETIGALDVKVETHSFTDAQDCLGKEA